VWRAKRIGNLSITVPRNLAHPSQAAYLSPLFLRLKNLFEFLTLYAKATSGENEKSEKILIVFGHLL
jgi:hypothetical protein